ncbi:hypothetical protein NC651_027452 [Populus alba x Populus x berolinensis]|nr:hypothetical protein NC651_027452 [Populus alba x Populus x berolinensis]
METESTREDETSRNQSAEQITFCLVSTKMTINN